MYYCYAFIEGASTFARGVLMGACSLEGSICGDVSPQTLVETTLLLRRDVGSGGYLPRTGMYGS